MKSRKSVKNNNLDDGNEYRLIDEVELDAREQKYINLMQDVNVSAGYINDIEKDFAQFQKEEVDRSRWRSFLECDGLPKPFRPQELRSFIEKQKFYEKDDEDKVLDWRLHVNERSILTQDLSRKDLTLKTLEKTQCPNIALDYDNSISLFLKVLNKINTLLENDAEMSEIGIKAGLDIINLKRTYEEEIDNILDRFTYRVIAMDDAYMKTVDGIYENYSYTSKNFNIHLWALRNIPIRFEHIEMPMEVNLAAIKVNVQLPFSVLSHNLILRGLHIKYDHYSLRAKSFELVVTKPTEHLNAGIPDIIDCLRNEWMTQMELQTEITDNILSKYLDYELELRDFNEKEAALLRKQKTDNSSKMKEAKLPKPPKPPLKLPENMYPDTYPRFIKLEHQQWIDFLNEFYNPETLKLNEGEINLRKYYIVGGVFSLFFVRKPKQGKFDSFSFTLHEDKRKLFTYKGIVSYLAATKTEMVKNQEYDLPGQIEGSRPPSLITEDIRKEELPTKMNEPQLFLVTFQLPKHLSLWGEPVACQLEECEVAVLDDAPTISPELLPHYFNKSTTSEDKIFGNKVTLNRPSRISRSRKGSTNVFRSSISALLRHSRIAQELIQKGPIEDFELNTVLNTQQVHTINRLCVPLLLSSVKFPLEAEEEERNEQEQKSFNKKSLFIRKNEDGEVDNEKSIIKKYFTFMDQPNPERVFPIFSPIADDLNYRSTVISEEELEPTTLYSLIQKFDNIKTEYNANCKKILKQNFVSKSSIKRHTVIDPDFETTPFNHIKITPLKSNKFVRDSVSGRTSHMAADKSSKSHSIKLTNVDELHLLEKYSESSVVPATDSTKIIKYTRWTVEHIQKAMFDKSDSTITIVTDRLGIFGFAYKRYAHFPFLDWSIVPNPEMEGQITLTLDTQHVRVILQISNKGFTGYVTDKINEFVLRPVKYLSIDEPLGDYRELKELFRDTNINIFAEHDAAFYIDKGYYSQKHLAAEFHIYDVLILHCMHMKFRHSTWNRLADRRDLILNMKVREEREEELTMRITPENTSFVEINELCSDDLNKFILSYKPTWRNVSMYSDLHQAICSVRPNAADLRLKDPLLMKFLKQILADLRPLSFS